MVYRDIFSLLGGNEIKDWFNHGFTKFQPEYDFVTPYAKAGGQTFADAINLISRICSNQSELSNRFTNGLHSIFMN